MGTDAGTSNKTFMSDHKTAQQQSDPAWFVASPGVGANNDAVPSEMIDAETAEERIERIRSLQQEEWARIEELGPSEQAMAELRVPPPPELFDEDWHKP